MTVTFGAVTPDRLQVVRNQNEQVDWNRADVLRVYRARKRSGARALAPVLGAAIGFGAGFGIGYATARGTWIPGPKAGAAIGAAGAVIGGVAGFFVRGKSRELIYRGEQTVKTRGTE